MGPEGGLTCGPAAALGTSVPLRGKADTWACFAGHRSGSHANVDAAIVDTGKTQPMSSFLDAKTTSKLPRRQSYLPKGPPLAERINTSCDPINHESWGLSLKVFPEGFGPEVIIITAMGPPFAFCFCFTFSFFLLFFLFAASILPTLLV